MHTSYCNHFSFKLGRIVVTAVVGAFLALILTGIHTAAATASSTYACILQNCSFESPSGVTSVPADWQTKGFKATSGGTDASVSTDGAQSLWFADTGKLRKVYQDVLTSGPAGTTFTLSFWTKSLNAQPRGQYRVYVVLYYVKGGPSKFYLNAPYGTNNWTQYTTQFVAKRDYKKVRVEIDFGKKGNAWFDEFQLSATAPGVS